MTMRVKELIVKLQACEPDAPVFGWDPDYRRFLDVSEVVQYTAMTMRNGEWIVTRARKGATAQIKGVVIR